ncbi:hypothetical protein BGZ81_009946 [Podila clonocystis]|nr:hypothetical protein BGZ81_009946 [Podila clonocystis]
MAPKTDAQGCLAGKLEQLKFWLASPGPELKRTRVSNGAETQATSDTNSQNEEEHIDAQPENEVDDELPLVRHRRHIVVSNSDTSLSFAEEAVISDRDEEADQIHDARSEAVENTIVDLQPSFEGDNEQNVAGASNRQAMLTTPSATPSIESETGASTQWPVLLTESEVPSTEEEENSRQKYRAKMKELGSQGLQSTTVYNYAKYLSRWETFCDKFYSGNYDIEPEKILHYFKTDLFVGKPTTIKVEDARNITIGRTKYDPLVQPTEAKAEAAIVRSRFEAVGAGVETKKQSPSSKKVRQSVRGKQQTVVPGKSQHNAQNAKKVSFSGTRPAPTRTSKSTPISVAMPVPFSTNEAATNSIPKPVVEPDTFTRTMGAFFEKKSIPHGTHSPRIRTRAFFALERHLHMSYQDLASLDLVDTFMEHFDITHNGSARKIRGESFPDFTDDDNWPRTKLLRGKDIFEPISTKAVEEAIRCELVLSGVKGREQSAAAIRELADLGICVEGPRKMGPNGETPQGMAALSGYHNEPYQLDRDVIPPLELQRQIFPMIERQHGSMNPAQWRAHCDEVMKDPTGSPGSGVKQGAAVLRRLEAAQENMDEYLGVARLDLLHFFLWLRRIVLQDMALFIRDNSVSGLAQQEVFHTPEFVRFQTDLLERMKEHVPVPSQDRGSASGSRPTMQHVRKNNVTSSRAPASRDRSERRHIGSHQLQFDEQSLEVDNKPPWNDSTHSDHDLHIEDLDDYRVDSQVLQQWIDQDRIQQQQAHRSLGELLRRGQDRQQKSHERELRRIQQEHEQEKKHLEGLMVRMEQKLDQKSEQLRSIRQRMVGHDEYIKGLEKTHRGELLELEGQLTIQADQITWHEQRLQQLEEKRDNRRREQLTQRLRGLDQKALERQQPGSRPSEVKMQGRTWRGAQKNRDAGVATGLKAVSKSSVDDEAHVPEKRMSDVMILLDDDDREE